MTRTPHLEVGYIARAHGLGGEVAVRTHDPASTVLRDAKRILLDTAPDAAGKQSTLEMRVLSLRRAAREWLVRLEGISDRNAAEALRRAKVSVFRADLDAAEESEGEFFQGDLIGLTAVDEQGRELGTLVEIWNTGPVPNLVFRGPGPGAPAGDAPEATEWVVPFADTFVQSVDLAGGRIVIRRPEYVD